jgi:alditol oxidase
MRRRNWAGNLTYRARRLHRPETLEQLAEIVASVPKLRVLGTRHSFSDIADGDEQVTLDALPEEIVVDHDGSTVSCSAWITYGRLAAALHREGCALANLASLPHISVGGAVATATHGSGNGNGNLATSVAALEIMTSDGTLHRHARGDPEFDGIVVGLGAVGAVTRVTLDVEPAYDVRQWVFEDMSWASLIENFDAVTDGGYSVSVFSRWGARVEQVWVKRRVSADDEAPGDSLFGARAATVKRHPLLGVDPVHATEQLGAPGLWSDRLPHFRMGFTPSSGEELQSEYLMPRHHAPAAVEAMSTLSEVVHPLVQVAEIRTVAADELWMSPAYKQDLVAFHFTWIPDDAAVGRALAGIERVLTPFEARPHWGKLFRMRADQIADLYPRLDDFRSLLDRLDARGAFRNPWLERVLGADDFRRLPRS